jgi:predicted flap endonuclease-1-like 5' DNA nuclease
VAELFSGPLMSIALVILAGIALRYALRMGRERDAEGVDHASLEQRNQALRSALETAQSEHGELRTQYDRITEDCQSLRAALEAQETFTGPTGDIAVGGESNRENGAKLASLEAANATLEEQLVAAVARLSDAEGRSEALNQQLDECRTSLHQRVDERHELLQQRDELAAERDTLARIVDTETAKVTSAESRHQNASDMQSDMRSELAVANQRFEAAVNECSKLQEALHEAELQVADLSHRQLGESVDANEKLRAVEVANHQLSSELSELECNLAGTHQELEESQLLTARMQADLRFVKQLRSDRSKLMTATENLQQQIEDLNQRHQEELDIRSRQHADELDQVRAEWALLQEAQSNHAACEQQFQQQLMTKDAQLQEALDAQSMLERQLQDASEKRSQHDALTCQIDDRLRDLQTEKDELTHGLQREQETNFQLTAELEDAGKRVRKMELELTHLDLLRQDHNCVSEELEQVTTKCNELQAERDTLAESDASARRELMGLDTQASRMEQELKGAKSLSRELREENESLQLKLARSRSEKTTLERLLEVHSETLQRMRADSVSIETLLERQSAVQESLQEHAERMRSVAQDSPDASPNSKSADHTRHETADILTFHESLEGDPRIDRVLGLVYDRPPQSRDDLKRISGIGTVLEEKLNRLGVYRYEQVMHWTNESVIEFSKLLAFRDRIGRDDWIGQARRLFLTTGSRVA